MEPPQGQWWENFRKENERPERLIQGQIKAEPY